MDDKNKINNIEEYIAGFPAEIQVLLTQMRETIRDIVPEARETISYQIPTFNLEGNLVHFAAFKNHIGFYPGPSSIEAFKEELSSYECAKGTIKFPFGRGLPTALIGKIVQLRVKENLSAQRRKKPGEKTC